MRQDSRLLDAVASRNEAARGTVAEKQAGAAWLRHLGLRVKGLAYSGIACPVMSCVTKRRGSWVGRHKQALEQETIKFDLRTHAQAGNVSPPTQANNTTHNGIQLNC